MKIAVIGAGAMGSIYGGHLSLQNEVWLVDTNQETVEHIQKNGLILQEEGQDITYHPSAVTSSEGLPPMDLVILLRRINGVLPMVSRILFLMSMCMH